MKRKLLCLVVLVSVLVISIDLFETIDGAIILPKDIKGFSRKLFLRKIVPPSKRKMPINPDKGKIYGFTLQTCGWCLCPLPFTLVVAKSGSFHKSAFSLLGYYEINDLPLDRTYTVIGYHRGYRCPSPVVVKLTASDPEVRADIYMERTNESRFP